MSERTFVYALHIATTPEKLWEALTRNEFWQQYWNGEWRIESDWQVGSPLKYYSGDGKFFSQGEVLASDPPNTLSYTWPNPPDEQGDAPVERLTWKITSSGPSTVRLELVHENLVEAYYQNVGEGWTIILSNLKTLLETGKLLEFHPRGR